jgi:predicted metal-dependent peptidase
MAKRNAAAPVLDMSKLKTRLSKAKTSLVLEHPFFGSIALGMPHDFSDDIPTAATNGKRVLYNPKFVDELNDEELKFLVAHEVFHPMMEHPFRRGSKDHRKWNKAGDYVINWALTKEGIGKMPKGGLLSDEIYEAGGGTTDGIYNILPEETGNGDGEYPGTAIDVCEDAGGSPAEQAQQEAEWKVKMVQAAQAAKMMGKLSANIERLVGQILNPKVPWQDVLRRFTQRAKLDTRTFARPNRRFISQGIYLPSKGGEQMGELVFAVDCSGSIGPEDIDQAAAEMTTVKQDCNPTKLHVVYFDSEVCHYDSFGPDDELVVKAHGGGGTKFSPVFRYLEEHDIDPVACVFLTDLECSDFGPAPAYPVLWMSTSKSDAPFGEVTLIK